MAKHVEPIEQERREAEYGRGYRDGQNATLVEEVTSAIGFAGESYSAGFEQGRLDRLSNSGSQARDSNRDSSSSRADSNSVGDADSYEEEGDDDEEEDDDDEESEWEETPVVQTRAKTSTAVTEKQGASKGGVLRTAVKAIGVGLAVVVGTAVVVGIAASAQKK